MKLALNARGSRSDHYRGHNSNQNYRNNYNIQHISHQHNDQDQDFRQHNSKSPQWAIDTGLNIVTRAAKLELEKCKVVIQHE